MVEEWEEEQEEEEQDEEWDAEEIIRIVDALQTWALTHPEPKLPFLFVGERNYTPLQFYEEVNRKTEFRRSFLAFLFAQAEIYKIAPHDFVERAMRANRHP